MKNKKKQHRIIFLQSGWIEQNSSWSKETSERELFIFQWGMKEASKNPKFNKDQERDVSTWISCTHLDNVFVLFSLESS